MPQPTLSLLLLLFSSITPGSALTALPAGVDITEDTPGQVTINGDPTGNATTLPTTMTIFSGVPGPSRCRGSVLLSLALPPPPPPPPSPSDDDSSGSQTAETCYNLARPAGCGNFVASKGAGCEARLFSEPGCRLYVNTAVFIPEERAVGGVWRSLGVRCGIPPPDPETLGAPPLAGLGVVRRPGGGGG
jgi:hypothetical protein